MTLIEQVNQAKQELAIQLWEALRTFSHKTGARVTDIRFFAYNDLRITTNFDAYQPDLPNLDKP